MIDHYQLFKELLTTFFFEFVDLFFPDLSGYVDRDEIVFLDKELLASGQRRRKREVDIVAKVKFRNPASSETGVRDGFFLIHIENQSSRQGDFEKENVPILGEAVRKAPLCQSIQLHYSPMTCLK